MTRSTGRTKEIATPYSLDDEIGYLCFPELHHFYAQRLAAVDDLDSIRANSGNIWLLVHGGAVKLEKPKEPLPVLSDVLHDSGIAILRTGIEQETRKHIAFNYGKGSYAHSHHEKLALWVFAYGYDLTAEVGYPISEERYGGWETQTASHCTAVVDEKTQAICMGSLNLFKAGPGLKVVDG